MVVVRALLVRLGVIAIALCAEAIATEPDTAQSVAFARDIRPIIAEHCYQCHGPDAATREAELRLDQHTGLFGTTSNSNPTIVPHQRDASELFRRIASNDVAFKMPPPDSGSSLTEAEIDAVGKWIDSGAAWQQHWAYQSPTRPRVPPPSEIPWGNSQIDAFVLPRMLAHGLAPSEQAGRRTLIRRLTLDLTGLPPTADEIDSFLADSRPGAYERLVDRFLQTPRFGERMATPWLDLARYADTHGYHMDAHRDMWRWRDWVIEAFNGNMTFDQFTIEQLAGDQLSDATLSQRIATGFNRNNMVNFENGVLADEFLIEYAVDRVSTTATVWLGQTIACARCHDHKYDPISQRDFYRLMAFFNQVPENGVDGDKGNATPFIAAPLPHQVTQLKSLEALIESLEARQKIRVAEVDAEILKWETKREARDTIVVVPQPTFSLAFEMESLARQAELRGNRSFVPGKAGEALLFDETTSVRLPNSALATMSQPFTIGLWLFSTKPRSASVIEQRKDGKDTFTIQLKESRVVVRLASSAERQTTSLASEPVIGRRWQHLAVRFNGDKHAMPIEVFVNGESVAMLPIDEADDEQGEAEDGLTIGSQHADRSFRGMIDELRLYSRALSNEEIAIVAGGDPIGDILAVERAARTNEQSQRLRQYYLEHFDEAYREVARQLKATRRKIAEVQAAIPTTMVMQDASELRPTYVLERGRYDSPGEVVTAGVPSVFQQIPASEPNNRLALARWLTRPDHPLTARVAVNRLWQTLFGAGLVRTPEDFGTRGELPTHPELLDWLATEFATDWDVKRLVRLIVTSATYRQSSDATTQAVTTDPENRWLARASRTRLSAEAIRDNALFASGLLVERTGGPSVFPYQPDGIWEAIAYNSNDYTAQVYRQSHGEDLYRRSIYTFVKRSAPSATLDAFDLPSRETCVARRSTTNTPQQALVLMNDVAFVEAARALATAVSATQGDDAKLSRMFVAATSRLPSDQEQTVLLRLVEDLHKQYSIEPELANDLITVGESAASISIDSIDVAVWTVVANVVLSLDEAITRP